MWVDQQTGAQWHVYAPGIVETASLRIAVDCVVPAVSIRSTTLRRNGNEEIQRRPNDRGQSSCRQGEGWKGSRQESQSGQENHVDVGEQIKTTCIYAGIDSRFGGEVGPSHKLSGSEPHLLTIEAGLGAIREVRLPGKVDKTFGTGRVGVNYRYVISKAADFQNQTNLILNPSNRDDWRLTSMAAVTALLKSHLLVEVRLHHCSSQYAAFGQEEDGLHDRGGPRRKVLEHTTASSWLPAAPGPRDPEPDFCTRPRGRGALSRFARLWYSHPKSDFGTLYRPGCVTDSQ